MKQLASASWQSESLMARALFGVLAAYLSAACGGPTSQTEARSVDEVSQESDDDFGDGSNESGSNPSPRPCENGSCTECGDSVCLSGFYCDESAQACAWLPDCPSELTCECVTRSLPECQCEERDGGVYVSCD